MAYTVGIKDSVTVDITLDQPDVVTIENDQYTADIETEQPNVRVKDQYKLVPTTSAILTDFGYLHNLISANGDDLTGVNDRLLQEVSDREIAIVDAKQYTDSSGVQLLTDIEAGYISNADANAYVAKTEISAYQITYDSGSGPVTASFQELNDLTVSVESTQAGITGDLTAVTASVNTMTDAYVDSLGNATATYGIEADANGNVASMKLSSSTTGGSDVAFRADTFKVYNGTSNLPVFAVSGSKIALNTNVEIDGNLVTTGKIASVDGSTYLDLNNNQMKMYNATSGFTLDSTATGTTITPNIAGGYIKGTTVEGGTVTGTTLIGTTVTSSTFSSSNISIITDAGYTTYPTQNGKLVGSTPSTQISLTNTNVYPYNATITADTYGPGTRIKSAAAGARLLMLNSSIPVCTYFNPDNGNGTFVEVLQGGVLLGSVTLSIVTSAIATVAGLTLLHTRTLVGPAASDYSVTITLVGIDAGASYSGEGNLQIRCSNNLGSAMVSHSTTGLLINNY